jgi:hypothetical protein
MRGGDHGHQLRKTKLSRSPLRRAAFGENLKNLFPINFAPVAHGEQVKNPFGTIEVVDHSIVAHAKAESSNSLHAMMRVAVQRHSQTIMPDSILAWTAAGSLKKSASKSRE